MTTFTITVEAEVVQERGLLEPTEADIERVLAEHLTSEQLLVTVTQGARFEGVRIEVKGAKVKASLIGGTGC